jgi:hypothetical protein
MKGIQFIYIHQRRKRGGHVNHSDCGPLRLAAAVFTTLILLALAAGIVALILYLR